MCFWLVLVAIIVPFFLAFSTHEFWVSLDVYAQQPIVLYRNEIIIAVYSETRTVAGQSIAITPYTHFFSTIGTLNQLSSDYIMPVQMGSTYWDYNHDNLIDMYEFNITLNLSPRDIRNVKIFTNYNYKLHNIVNLEMVSMALVDFSAVKGFSSLYIDGSLKLRQINPLKSSKIVRKAYNTSLFDFNYNTPTNFFTNLFANYYARNETTIYDYKASSVPEGSDDSVFINMKIRIPPYEHIWYIPLFIQSLKFAWIQYLSLLIPIAYILYSFASYIYFQQILDTVIEIKY
jgi:transmembrane protein 231